MTRKRTLSSSRRGILSIEAAFLSLGYVGDGQADGPYPGMYEHWSIRHLHKSSGSRRQLSKRHLAGEHTMLHSLIANALEGRP